MVNVFNLRDSRLLMKSEAYKDYPILQLIFSKYSELNRSDINKLTNEERIFIDNIYPKILSQINKEWEHNLAKKPLILENRSVECDICTHILKTYAL